MPVFAVEYLTDAVVVEAARERLLGFGFVPYFAPRLLDRLMTQPGEAAAPVAPANPSPPSTRTPGPTWAEGGPTCLVD